MLGALSTQTRKTVRVYGLVEHWDPAFAAVLRVGLAEVGGTFVATAAPDADGVFSIDTPARPVSSGRLELRVEGPDGTVRGATRLAAPSGAAALGALVRLWRPPGGVTVRLKPGAFVPSSSMRRLRQGLARLQGVPPAQVRVPVTVLTAVEELDRIDGLADGVLKGEAAAAEALAGVLAAAAFSHPGGDGGGSGSLAGARGRTFRAAVADAVAGGDCGPILTRGLRVLDAAFRLDRSARDPDGRHLRQAVPYVRTRMRMVSDYLASVDRALGEPPGGGGGGGWGRPPEDGFGPLPEPGPSADPLGGGRGRPPEGGFMPPPDPVPPAGPAGDLCSQVQEMCLGLYAELLAAQARDTLTDLIASVEPDCPCGGFDPRQVFVARPAPGRDFSTARAPGRARLRDGVELHVAGRRIVPLTVDRQEIRFRLPAGARGGSVHLHALGALPAQASRDLARACGFALPVLPVELPTNRQPAARLTIVYPPVVESFSSSAGGGPAEACRPVELRWRVRLLDMPGHLPLAPCASIEVTVRDGTGAIVAAGGAAGSVVETRDSDVTYTIEARSRAGGVLCGVANPETLTVARVRRLYLEADPATGTQIAGGMPGRILVRSSCPAPAGGLTVLLASTDPAALRVPPQAMIPAGQDAVQVEFGTSDACTRVELTATAPGHAAPPPLGIEVFRTPQLAWAAGRAPLLRPLAAGSVEVDAGCLPDEGSRQNWTVQPAAPGSPPTIVRAMRVAGASASGRYVVSVPRLAEGDWRLAVEIPDRGGLRSNELTFRVAPLVIDLRVSPTGAVDIPWGGEATFEVAVEGANLIDATDVRLSAAHSGPNRAANGLAMTMSPTVLTLTAANPAARAHLTVGAPVAASPLGPASVTVTARASGIRQRTAGATLRVLRATGAFVRTPPAYAPVRCGGVTATPVDRDPGPGFVPGVRFSIPAAGANQLSYFDALYFAISPHCRVGVVLPRDELLGPALNLVNLGFGPGAGAPALGMLTSFGPPYFWQAFWFSPDDSLLLVIGRIREGSGTPNTHDAAVYDTVRHRRLGYTQFIPDIIEADDDPSPLLNGETEIRLAVVDGAELVRDGQGRERVVVAYRANRNQRWTLSVDLPQP